MSDDEWLMLEANEGDDEDEQLAMEDNDDESDGALALEDNENNCSESGGELKLQDKDESDGSIELEGNDESDGDGLELEANYEGELKLDANHDESDDDTLVFEGNKNIQQSSDASSLSLGANFQEALKGSLPQSTFGWLTAAQTKRLCRLAERFNTHGVSGFIDNDDRRLCEGVELLSMSEHGQQQSSALAGGGAQLILSPARAKLWPLLPSSLRIVDAVMGVAMPKPHLDALQARARRPLQPGEVGILMSYQAAWSHAVERGWEWSLVLEDDATVQLPGSVAQLLALLPSLVEAATCADPDWQLLVLSPYGLENFYGVMEPARIPSLHGANLPKWARTPLRLGDSGWRRVGPTFHAFGWVYRAPLMRKLLDGMRVCSPPLNPLDVWVWEVMAANDMLGCALSPVIVPDREQSGTPANIAAVAEFKAALVSTRAIPGGGDSLRGFNDGQDMASLTKQMSSLLGGNADSNALGTCVHQSCAASERPTDQALSSHLPPPSLLGSPLTLSYLSSHSPCVCALSACVRVCVGDSEHDEEHGAHAASRDASHGQQDQRRRHRLTTSVERRRREQRQYARHRQLPEVSGRRCWRRA